MHPDVQDLPNSTEMNEKFLKFSLNEIPPFLSDYAEKCINETEKNRNEGIKEILQMIEDDNDIEFSEDDSCLLMFLRFKKFDVPKAFHFFKSGLGYVDSYRKILAKNEPDLIRRVVKSNVFGFLPYRDAMGRAIIFLKSNAWDPDNISADDVVLGGIVSVQSAIFNPVNQVAGYVAILDLEELRIQQVLAMSRWLLFGIVTLQKACPCFLKAIHFINLPPSFKAVWKIIKPILSEKIKKRLIFHKASDLSTLYSHIPQEILPSELGGPFPFSNDHWTRDIDNVIRVYHEKLSRNGLKSRKNKTHSNPLGK